MSMLLYQTLIRFPEIKLATRDAEKLRGYFGNLFKQESPLLHNHLESGEVLYRYPLVQYKILKGVPTLVGINEGAELLLQLFMRIEMLEIAGITYPVLTKNIENRQLEIGMARDLHGYRFETLWMALNQKNFSEYQQESEEDRARHLKSLLIGNILSFCKAVHYQAQETILVNLKITDQRETRFKDHVMLVFRADFVTNMLLPDWIGLGKQTSRGFGSIVRI